MRHLLPAALLVLVGCQQGDERPPARGVSRSEIEGAPRPRVAASTRPAQPAKPGTRAPTAADLATYTASLPGKGPLTATIETSMGTIHCELAADKAPMTVANFIGLATGQHAWWDEGAQAAVKRPYFDGLTFHRVIPEFMIQGGDPTGTGAGGPGYQFADEVSTGLTLDRPGTLAMANAGPATNGSQFFITEVPVPRLNGKHTVFGYCKEIDVVKAIARVPTGAKDKPQSPVTIKSVTITRGAS